MRWLQSRSLDEAMSNPGLSATASIVNSFSKISLGDVE